MLFSYLFVWLISFFLTASILLWVCCKSGGNKKKPKAAPKKSAKKLSTTNDERPGTKTAVLLEKKSPNQQGKTSGTNKPKKKPILPPLPPATNYPLLPGDASTINVTLETTDASQMYMQKMPKSLHSQMTRKTQWDEKEKNQQRESVDQSERICPGSVFTEEDEDDSGEDSIIPTPTPLEQPNMQEPSEDTAVSQREQQSTEKWKEPMTAQSVRNGKKKQLQRPKELSLKTMEERTIKTVKSNEELPNRDDGSPTIRSETKLAAPVKANKTIIKELQVAEEMEPMTAEPAEE